MSYETARKRQDSEPVEVAPINYRCPAHGCPNAAAVSFDGSRWACFFHAKADPTDWPATTQWVGENWPKSANWGQRA